jgi:hypothetical protein
MTTRRFEVKSANELNRNKILSQPSEMIPLINTAMNIPPPPPLPTSFASINEINKKSARIFNNVLHRVKTSSSTTDITRKVNSSSLPVFHSHSTASLTAIGDVEGGEAGHSNTFDTSSHRSPNKFLHELLLKRRELNVKAKNLPIDQRIALNRSQHDRDRLRAQDIFAVHFEFNDTDNIQTDFFNEDVQENIRNKIFHELDRQRTKEYHKQHRQLVLGRALLMFITSLLIFMSLTVIYVVINLYNRAQYLDIKLADNEFLPMISDEPTDV